MEDLIKHYMQLGFKVTFQRGALHHMEVGLMKSQRLVTQHIKDDSFNEGYVRQVFEHMAEKFKPVKKAGV